MKRILCLVLVFTCVLFAVSCSKKKSHKENDYVEKVSKEINAEEGGTVESADGKTSVEIPGGALDGDTTITMTIRDASEYPDEKGKIVSKVVNFEPNGTIFKKPIVITMKVEEGFENKIVAAAVYNEKEGKWSYSENGERAILGRDEAGDPIMMGVSSAGDPIMLGVNSEGALTAAGDPIMSSAAGDPIMLASAGDPIMGAAAGDPIMSSAAGDPIMMSSGHFTEYTFIVLDPKKPAEPDDDEPAETDDDEPVAETDDDEPAETDDDEPAETDDDEPAETDDDEPVDDDIVPEPEPLYSKVVCTGSRTCFDENGKLLDECPESGSMSGQDAVYIFRKSCLPKSFEKIEKAENDVTPYQQIKDNNTGLTWLVTMESSQSYDDMAPYCGETLAEYAGGGWRMPTPAEILTIADHDMFNNLESGKQIKSAYFTVDWEGSQSFWTSDKNFAYDTYTGMIGGTEQSGFNGLLCVKGDEYGKVAASDYTSKNENGQEMIFDSKTNLLWQKTSVSGKTWKEALAYCEGLEYAGYTDWRLPNKNELATLVDYSKSNPASSFPGMPAELFVTSTTMMNTGEIAIDMKTGWTKMRSEAGGYSVICVRSDLLPYPENGIPECGDDGYAPCKAGNITWSQRLYYDAFENESVHWATVARDCREMKGGKWRLPNIDEIRTLFTDDVFKTGGSCGVTAAHNTYEYYEGCNTDALPGHETKLRDYGTLLAGTLSNANPDSGYGRDQWNAWVIDMTTGGMEDVSAIYAPYLIARCVLDDSITVPSIPYTDTENGLVWSSISKKGTWDEAVEYCGTLVEGGSDNWSVPTQEQLFTLVKDCADGNCTPDFSGKYSVLGDIAALLSSDLNDMGGGVTTLDFIDVYNDNIEIYSHFYNWESEIQARCVRLTEDPLEDPDKLDEETDFPYEYEDSVWSKKSGLVYSLSEAEAYCNSLNDPENGYAEYAGEDIEWTLPMVYDYVRILVDEDSDCSSQCFESIELEYEGDTYDCSCGKLFKSHSIFGDFGHFWASDTDETESIPYLFNFTTGEVTGGSPYYDNPGYVRCVAYLQV
jgi:hypothetical protein